MKDEKGRLPSFQFYPADWRSDPGVQSLTYHERGVWFEMLCIMHVADTRGRLTLNAKPMPVEALASHLGLLKQDTEIVLKKLLDYGVASRDDEGAIICRRMVRDEEIRLIRKAAGAKGGNPNFKKGHANPYYSEITPPITSHKQKISKKITSEIDGKDNQTDKQKITPSSSSAFASARLHPNTLVVSSETTPAQIPFEKLRDAYNERRGALPMARELTDERKRKIKIRWNEHPDIAFWESVFDKAGKSEFMLKFANLGWLMKSQENYTKTLEGNYDNDRDKKRVPRPASIPMPREKDPDPKDLPTAEEIGHILDRAGFKRRKRGGGLTPVGDASPSVPVESEAELPV